MTSNTITIGVTYVDLASVAQFIHGLDQGNYQAVYQALINNINAHGGIDGRTLKADLRADRPHRHHIAIQRVHPADRG